MLSIFRRERGFYHHFFILALPCIVQNLVTTALGFVDTFMVGLLGNAEMAAVTAANVPIFILQLILFGFQSGMAILISQHWGSGDTDSISRATGIAFMSMLALTTTVALVMFLAPEWVLSLITDEELLITLGTPYLQIVGFSYIFNGFNTVYAGLQRATENPTFGMVVFGISMLLNTIGNYALIFGKFGFPRLGITGAAAATLASRVVEFLIVIAYIAFSRRVPLRLSLLLRPGREMLHAFVKYSTPVVLNETLWSTGTSMLTVVMGHMDESVEMLAAHAIMGNIDKFSTVICFGVAAASSVMIGKEIGEGSSNEHVQSLAKTLLALALIAGILTGGLLLGLLPVFFEPVLFPLFDLSPLAAQIATYMCMIYALTMPMRAFDVTNITGVLRAGGDVRAAICIDIIPLWCVAVPLSALAGVVLRCDPIWVCLAMQAENVCKLPAGVLRLKSRKWIHNVTKAS